MNGHEETTMQTHSFGGRWFTDRFVDFEAIPGEPAIGDLGGSEVTPPAAPPAAVPAPAEPVVPAAVEPPAQLTREDVIAAAREAALAGTSDAFREMVARAEAEEAQRRAAIPVALPEWDPYDPQTVTAHVVSSLAPILQRIEGALGSTMQVTESYQQAQGRLEAVSILDGFKQGDDALGDFDNDRAITGARALLAQDPRLTPELALRQAAQAEVEHDMTTLARGLEKLGLVAAAHLAIAPEPGSGAAAAGEVATLPRGKNAYTEQLKRSLASMGKTAGVASPA